MYKVIALIGESGCGKDSLMKAILTTNLGKEQFHEIISYTSRPIRDNETEGINYHYVSKEAFENLIISGQMFEYTNFNGWYYGTGINSLNENQINIGVFNPDGIRTLIKNPNIQLFTYYLQTSPKERLIRQLKREKNPNIEEIFRRYKTDQADFQNLEFPYTLLTNEKHSDVYVNVCHIIDEVEDKAGLY